jgi:tetratricopeptide (TPR) repeat protein/tRNA A-37 threonylcarbamoyl transferase component Bud32
MDEAALFAAALEKPTPAERRAFLDRACAGDGALRRRLERLLAADERTGGILEAGLGGLITAIPAREELAAGALFAGRFRLCHRLGEGGMGEVWVADQQEPVRRRVAIKVVRPGLDTSLMLARFEREWQALALMDHPNIAKVLDAGVADGRPYCVMELIDGVPVTAFCDASRLSTRQRLELFVGVCHAVQHAHQKGIIHRDLKPSNILVTVYDGKPVPKVIDFGVARATGPPAGQSAGAEDGSFVGTPAYMSPEQAEPNNPDVDTRTDVYSLGVVLYELLTGELPFPRRELQAAGLTEIRRVLKEVDPPRPSTRLCGSESLAAAAAVRRAEPRELVALVRGELDLVVLKCLEKDRCRRYETANSLAADLRHYLADEAVTAAPPSAAYLARKFVRRNRGAVLAAGLLLLALAGGTAGTAVGLVRADRARRAERERAEGERVAKGEAAKRLAQLEQGIGILGSILDNLDPNAEEKEGRPLRAILADRLDQAAAGLEWEDVGDPLVVARLRDRLGQTYLGLGRAAEAESLFDRALAARTARLGADHPDTLASMHNQALAYQVAHDLPRAIERFRQAHDARARVLGADHPDSLASLNHLGLAYRQDGKPAEAVELLGRAADARARVLGPEHPETLTTMNHLALALRAAGKRDEAVTLYERVRDARVKTLGPDHPQTLVTLHHLGLAYRTVKKKAEAIAAHEKVREARTRILGPDHPQTLLALSFLAGTYKDAGDGAAAIALYEQVRYARVRKLEADQQDAFDALGELAGTYARAGMLERALPLYLQAAVSVEERKFVHPNAGRVVDDLCDCYEQMRQFDRAEVWRRKWLAFVKGKDGPQSAAYARALNLLGSTFLLQNKPAAAAPVLRESLAILRRERPDDRDEFQAQSLLGAALTGQGRYDDAEPLLVRSYQGISKLERARKDFDPETLQHLLDVLERLVQLYDARGRPREAAGWRTELKKAEARRDQF